MHAFQNGGKSRPRGIKSKKNECFEILPRTPIKHSRGKQQTGFEEEAPCSGLPQDSQTQTDSNSQPTRLLDQ